MLAMYYYKARMYSPTLGRFMQTDPIGYGDGMNWHNYVQGDPVNRQDSSGFGFGFEIGLSGTRGSAPNLGTFTGFSDNLNGSIGPFSFSGSRSESNGNLYGSRGGGYSPAPGAASYTSTYTNIPSTTCSKQP